MLRRGALIQALGPCGRYLALLATERVPVLIVGGGGAGLTASMLLSTHGVKSRIDLVAIRIGHLMGDWLDPRLAFQRVREFGPAGAILARPDRVIAWRSMEGVDDPGREIGAVLDRVLARAS